MNLDDALQTFIAESRELLQDMEAALLACEKATESSEAINALFRAAHTIKGSAGLFGLEHIVAFTHVVESTLDKVRSGELGLAPALVAALLKSRDHMADLIEQLAQGVTEANADLEQAGAGLVECLKSLCQPSSTQLVSLAGTPDGAEVETETPAGCISDTDTWHISLRFNPDVLRNGMDPLAFLRYLTTLGSIEHIETLLDAMPSADCMDPETCYIGFEIAFRSTADKATIESAFDFIREESQIRILPPHSRISEYLELIKKLPGEDMRLGEILVRCGTLTEAELQQALALQQQTGDRTPLIGEVLLQHGMVRPAVMASALEKQKQVRETRGSDSRFIRVDAEKLDLLINLVGELIISGASISTIAQRLGVADLREATSILSRLVEEVRDTALNLRMVQIGSTFSRFQRVVRDVSQDLGKEIDLVISGAETELDKTVVEKIGDPLMHLVRNSVDHGIEPVEIRRSRGKPERGQLRLNAFHDSGSIIIEVGDDGNGLDRQAILAKGLQQGLVSEGQSLSEREIFNLIFEPGFSTAAQVSNLSGRGVGMDVVRRNIQALRGIIELESVMGVGTTVRIRLPLTLAIIDGFLVGVGDSSYVIPLDMVVECVELDDSRHSDDGKRYLNLRGEVLPYLRLREHFEIEGQAPVRENIVVVSFGGKKIGMVVDQLLGEFQTVIKPLGLMFSKVRGISGFTILGGGGVALVLDVAGLIQQVTLEQDVERQHGETAEISNN
jgi:two-component system, chemotaxis family, sensor kinase CheA